MVVHTLAHIFPQLCAIDLPKLLKSLRQNYLHEERIKKYLNQVQELKILYGQECHGHYASVLDMFDMPLKGNDPHHS